MEKFKYDPVDDFNSFYMKIGMIMGIFIGSTL